MQDKPDVIHGDCNKVQFDVRITDIKSAYGRDQQEVQNLLNISAAYAADPKCNDYTFCTKLYVAMSERQSVKSGKIRGWIEKYAGATWDKDAANGGQFKKDRLVEPDITTGGLAMHAWWLFESKSATKKWDGKAFFDRTTKSINLHGEKNEFKRNDAEQASLDALIYAARNEGFEINIPEDKHEAPTLEVPDWQKQVEDTLVDGVPPAETLPELLDEPARATA